MKKRASNRVNTKENKKNIFSFILFKVCMVDERKIRPLWCYFLYVYMNTHKNFNMRAKNLKQECTSSHFDYKFRKIN